MTPEEHRDRLVDTLLWELVGKETPPDVRARVLEAAGKLPRRPVVRRKPHPRLVSLPRPKRSMGRVFAFAATVVLLGTAGLAVWVRQIANARTPVLTSVTGTVDRSSGPLPAGTKLSTGSLSRAVLTYPDGTVVELSSETAVVLADPSFWDRSKGLELTSGGVVAKVARQPADRPMMFKSNKAKAVVVGTELSFHTNADRTRLEVKEGVVRFVPATQEKAVLVKTGFFAEGGKSGFLTGALQPMRGITRFTLMNAETDRPIREEALVDGETISLSLLPTQEINLRADYEGNPPASVKLNVTRSDGEATGVPPFASDEQKQPPFFVAGDHWAEGRPQDCRSWTPRPGLYHLSAEAFEDEDGGQSPTTILKITFQIVE